MIGSSPVEGFIYWVARQLGVQQWFFFFSKSTVDMHTGIMTRIMGFRIVSTKQRMFSRLKFAYPHFLSNNPRCVSHKAFIQHSRFPRIRI